MLLLLLLLLVAAAMATTTSATTEHGNKNRCCYMFQQSQQEQRARFADRQTQTRRQSAAAAAAHVTGFHWLQSSGMRSDRIACYCNHAAVSAPMKESTHSHEEDTNHVFVRCCFEWLLCPSSVCQRESRWCEATALAQGPGQVRVRACLALEGNLHIMYPQRCGSV